MSKKSAWNFIKDRKGVAAVWFGMMVPLLVTSVGLSVDVGQSYLVRERLSHALDAAALAAAATPTDDENVIEQKVQDFIDANYPEGKVGFHTDIQIQNSEDKLYVIANAELKPAFGHILGKDKVNVQVDAEVTKEVKAMEVVLVMDVTGSMATKNNGVTRIDALKSAADLFVTTMFDRVSDPEDLRIGLVPFSSSVNVGPTGLSDNFVNNPSKLKYSTTDTKEWGGCILEGASPTDTQDHEGPWDMYRYCRTSTGAVIPNCDTTRSGKSPNYTYTANRDQNYNCPKTPVTPMTNDEKTLTDNLKLLKAEGNTYINVGLVWGYRMISPDFPFEQGAAWDDEDWQKTIILMTDGTNEVHSYYSAYGPSATANMTNTKLNNRMMDVCDELRDKHVLVYTITFDNGVSAATKTLFQQCATQPSMWYDAPTTAKLQEVYQTIARELANMHLSK